MSEIKIRTIPRPNEKLGTPVPEAAAPPRKNMARVFIGLSLAVFIIGGLGVWHSSRAVVERQLAKSPAQPDRLNASINRHLYDTHLMEQMRKRKNLLESQAMAPAQGQ